MATYPTGSIGLTGPIGTTDITDIFNTHYDFLGQGGLQTVVGTTERDAITTPRRSFGMLASTQDGSGVFKLVNASDGGVDNDITNNANWVAFSGGGGSMTIGNAVIGGSPNRVLYIDNAGALAVDNPFQYDAATGYMSIGQTLTPDAKLDIGGVDSDNYMKLLRSYSADSDEFYIQVGDSNTSNVYGNTRFLINPADGFAMQGVDSTGNLTTQFSVSSYNGSLYSQVFDGSDGSYGQILITAGNTVIDQHSGTLGTTGSFQLRTDPISGTINEAYFGNQQVKIGFLAGGGDQMAVINNDGVLGVQAIPSGGTPGGANTNVQYNDGGAFGGDDNFTWDKTNTVFSVGNLTGFINARFIVDGSAQTVRASTTSFAVAEFNLSNNSASLGDVDNVSSGTYFIVSDIGQDYTFSKGNFSINSVSYVFPGSNAAGSLNNDGAGNLSWVAGGGGTVTSITAGTGLSGGTITTSGTITNNLATGISGGQQVFGGTGASEDLTLNSTTNGTKGVIHFGQTQFNEQTNTWGISISPVPGIRLLISSAQSSWTTDRTLVQAGNPAESFSTGSGLGLTSTGAYFASVGTRTGGTAPLTNIGLVAFAQTGQFNYAAMFPYGDVGIGGAFSTFPTASLHLLDANTTSHAQMKFTLGGSLLTTPQAGAVEAINSHLYWTDSTGTRFQLDQQTGGGGTVTSVSGTTNRITSTGGTTPVIDISASYVGQSSITTLGTVTTGVWNGTAIANANLANSTISGISLGSNLANLTATDTTLTFSGAYNGSTARTVGLNLTNANLWTGFQTFSSQATVQTPVTGSTSQFVGLDANPLRITFDTHNSASASGTAFMVRRSRGTAATPSAVQSGDTLASYNARGYGTSQYAAGSTGLVSMVATENFTNTANGTAVTISTTPIGSVTGAESARFTDTGLTLGVTGTLKGSLNITGNTSGTISILPQAAAGTYNFNLPITAGTAGQALVSQAGGSTAMTWATLVPAASPTFTGTLTAVTIAASGQISTSFASVASTPGITGTGTWFTGGSATTTKPYLLIEPAGTTSTAWSTAGTGIGINAASGFVGLLIDLKANNTSQFSVSATGNVSAGNTTVGTLSASDIKTAANNTFNWNGRSTLWSASDGVIRLSNNAGTDFGRLQFGLTTSAAPAIKRNGAALNFRLADDSADAAITAASITSSGSIIASGAASTVRLKGYTVATLPAGTQGDSAFCTDLLAPTFFAAAVGGGAIVGPVFYNGTTWICT